MKSPATVIAIATIYLLVFQLAILLDFEAGLIFTLLSFSPFIILYMAYIILRYGHPSKHTFDEKFYDD